MTAVLIAVCKSLLLLPWLLTAVARTLLFLPLIMYAELHRNDDTLTSLVTWAWWPVRVEW